MKATAGRYTDVRGLRAQRREPRDVDGHSTSEGLAGFGGDVVQGLREGARGGGERKVNLELRGLPGEGTKLWDTIGGGQAALVRCLCKGARGCGQLENKYVRGMWARAGQRPHGLRYAGGGQGCVFSPR